LPSPSSSPHPTSSVSWYISSTYFWCFLVHTSWSNIAHLHCSNCNFLWLQVFTGNMFVLFFCSMSFFAFFHTLFKLPEQCSHTWDSIVKAWQWCPFQHKRFFVRCPYAFRLCKRAHTRVFSSAWQAWHFLDVAKTLAGAGQMRGGFGSKLFVASTVFGEIHNMVSIASTSKFKIPKPISINTR
jgi:hypothetical protein